MNWSRLILTIAVFDALLVVSHSLYDSFYPCQHLQCSHELTVKVGQESHSPYGYIEFPVKESYQGCACKVNLEVRPGYQLSLRFSSLKLECSRGAYVNVSGQTNSHTYCEWSSNYPALYTTSNFVNITYFSGRVPSSNANEAVSLYYTTFHTGSCDYDEFRCAYTGRCISNEVSCDGIDNCGDWYDESVWSCGLTTAMIVAISISSALAGISLFICVALSMSKRHKSRRSRTADDTNADSQLRGHVAEDHRNRASASEQVDLKTIVPPGPPPYTYTNYVTATVDGDLPTPYYEVCAFGESPPVYDPTQYDKSAVAQ